MTTATVSTQMHNSTSDVTTGEQTALLIYGLPGAGKSTVLDIAESFNIPSVTMGDVVRERARKEIGEDASSSMIGEWATKQREQHGDAVMAEYTAEYIQSYDDDIVVIEGVRSPAEKAVFDREATMNIVTLRIDAPFAARLSRLQDRGRDGEADFTAVDLIDRDSRELSWGVGELFTADTPEYVIANDASLDAYKQQVQSAFNDLTQMR